MYTVIEGSFEDRMLSSPEALKAYRAITRHGVWLTAGAVVLVVAMLPFFAAALVAVKMMEVFGCVN